MAIWRLPIHTPWGSASERKTVGKAAEGEREEVQVWEPAQGLCASCLGPETTPGGGRRRPACTAFTETAPDRRSGDLGATWAKDSGIRPSFPGLEAHVGRPYLGEALRTLPPRTVGPRGGLCIWGLATPRVHTGSHVCTPPLACPHAHSIAWPPRDWAPSVLLVVPLRWGQGEAHRPQDAGLGPWVGVTGTAPRAHPATEGGQTGHRGSQSGATGGHSGQRTAGPAMGRKRREPRPPRALPCLCRGRALPRPDLPPSGHLHSEVLQLPHGSLVRPGWVCPTPDGHLTPSWAWPGRAK